MQEEPHFMGRNNDRQLDLFLEGNPGAAKRFERVNFRVSVLGGEAGAAVARELGYQLGKKWFSVATGGYAFGTMQAALEGANAARQELEHDSSEKKYLSMFNPTVTGVVAENFQGPTVQGEYVGIDVAEGNYDVYLRLAKLIEDSSVCIVLPGDTGTETEVMANLHFNQKLKAKMRIPTRPIIFVGNGYEVLFKKFRDAINNDVSQVYQVETSEEAMRLVCCLSAQKRDDSCKVLLDEKKLYIIDK